MFYAVKEGNEIGIFEDWNACQNSTKGYSGAKFKKFKTLKEAEAYMDDIDIHMEEIKKNINDGYIAAFCDGSYNKKTNRYSYGVLIIDDKLEEHEICSSSSNKNYISFENVVGEISGAINAMDWAISNNYDKIAIYYDYEGVEKWISKEWEAKSDVAKMYTSVFESKYEGLLEIKFIKVKGHSNNKYNDRADQLAKNALQNNERIPITGDNWYTLSMIYAKDLKIVLDLIVEEHPNIEISEINNTNTIYKLTLNNDKVTVTHFHTNSLLIQASNNMLMQILTTCLNELLDVDETKVLSSVYRKTINKKEIIQAVNDIFPSLPADYPKSMIKLIRQSIINLKHSVECEDYSQYVFPALRALEGHMKYLFFKFGSVTITNNQPIGSYFNKDPNQSTYILSASCITCRDTKKQLEECYNYYHTHRHSLFHFGAITGNSNDDTRIINNQSEATEHIKKCLSFIKI